LTKEIQRALAVLFLTVSTSIGAPRGTVEREALGTEMDRFLAGALSDHLAAIPTLDPPPDRVFGALTTGEFTWGSFMRALGEYQQMSGKARLADRDLGTWVGQMGLIEARGAGKAFSQMYAALALRAFGTDLRRNAVWQSLSAEERDAWRSLLDPGRFYDASAKQVIDLPENYLGVASRVTSVSHELGLTPDRAAMDALLDRAASPFVSGELYADDQPPVGRYDRYSNEYARYVFIAATIAGRQDIVEKVRPSLKTQMRLWWDLVSEDGYGFPWGRSLGLISYLDTMEIVGFLAENPEFRPAPLPELAAAFHAAWRFVRRDYNDKTHLFSVFDFGRGNYAYISREREWQQVGTSLGKIASAAQAFLAGARREKLDTFPDRPRLDPVARWEWFRQGDRPSGVWVVRQGELRFALPITSGTWAGVADYLPAPHGLPGFSSPVERPYPSLVPWLEFADGRTLVTADGADRIEPSADGQSLRVLWRRMISPLPEPLKENARAVDLVDAGVQSDVRFRIESGRLVREEMLTAQTPIRLARWWVAVPVRYPAYRMVASGKDVTHVFSGHESELAITISGSSVPLRAWVSAAGDSLLGHGDRGGLPLHLLIESRNVEVTPARPFRWTLTLEPRTAAQD
jgi:hypothetical protein